ncbi:MAG: alpha/beta hydrolase [Betaproteobacteria bacterium]
MLLKSKIILCAFASYAMLGLVNQGVQAQSRDRNLEEVKEESLIRAELGGYPLGGLDFQDSKDALSKLTSREPDNWAAAWSGVADKYMEQAKKAPDINTASALYKKAWRLYFTAQWPAPTSAGKQVAYDKAIDAYLKHSQNLDPKLQVVKIPFEGKEIVGYLRVPNIGKGPYPIIFAFSGLDSRKETVADSYAQILKYGVAIFVMDSPGTGQAPIKASPTAERMFSAAIDYVTKLPEIDKTRVIASGVSFGGYWATKLAILEKHRLLGSVAQSPPIDKTFSAEFIDGRIFTREYLFDYLPASLFIYEGLKTKEDLLKYAPSMSLRTQGLLDKPTAPMLVIGGAKDSQVLLSELQLLMSSGDVPKEFWLNPIGGHLGREAKGWTDPVIFSKVVIPWELRLLEQTGWKSPANK